MPPHRRKGGATPTRRRGRPTPPTPSTFHGSRHASRPGLQAAQRATPRRWQIAAGGSARRQPAAPPFPGEPERRRPSLPRESADNGGVRSKNGVAGGGRFRCGWVRAILPFPHRHCAAAATPLETGGSQCGHGGGAYRRSAAAPAAAAAGAVAHAVCLKPRAYNFCARRPSWGREGLAAAVPLPHARPCPFHPTRVVGVSRGLGGARLSPAGGVTETTTWRGGSTPPGHVGGPAATDNERLSLAGNAVAPGRGWRQSAPEHGHSGPARCCWRWRPRAAHPLGRASARAFERRR